MATGNFSQEKPRVWIANSRAEITPERVAFLVRLSGAEDLDLCSNPEPPVHPDVPEETLHLNYSPPKQLRDFESWARGLANSLLLAGDRLLELTWQMFDRDVVILPEQTHKSIAPLALLAYYISFTENPLEETLDSMRLVHNVNSTWPEIIERYILPEMSEPAVSQRAVTFEAMQQLSQEPWSSDDDDSDDSDVSFELPTYD